MNIITHSIEILGSPTFGVILSLLLVFQWHKGHAKEQAVKSVLFAMRRKVERHGNDRGSASELNKARDMVDDLDAVLATLGSRKPFRRAMEALLKRVTKYNEVEDKKVVDENMSTVDISQFHPKLNQ